MAVADNGPEIERLDWDDRNRKHIAKHGVVPSEVEEAVFGKTVAQPTYKNRILVLGSTHAGKLLAVVIGPVPGQSGAYYAFSARPATRSERRFYKRVKAGAEQ